MPQPSMFGLERAERKLRFKCNKCGDPMIGVWIPADNIIKCTCGGFITDNRRQTPASIRTPTAANPNWECADCGTPTVARYFTIGRTFVYKKLAVGRCVCGGWVVNSSILLGDSSVEYVRPAPPKPRSTEEINLVM